MEFLNVLAYLCCGMMLPTFLQVDMPVFFYIDPDFSEDPAMAKVDEITLSYTFFEAREGEDLPLPTSSHQLGTP